MSIALATKGVISVTSASGIGGGTPYPEPVPSCDPEAVSDEVGALHLDATIIEVDVIDITPGVYPTVLPDPAEVGEVLPTLRSYPLPSNL